MNNAMLLKTIIIAGAIILLGYMALLRADRFVDLENKKVHNIAIDACLKDSRSIHENKIEGTRTEEPIKERFDECMKEKGY